MNVNHLHDAFSELPEELVASVIKEREQKKAVWVPWVAAAACACLVFVLGWQFMPLLGAKNAAPENQKVNGFMDMMEAPACNAADSLLNKAELVLLVQVKRIEEGGILVQVLPKQEIAEGTQIRIPVIAQQEAYAEGDRLKIYCDGILLETWPLQLNQLFGIERVEAP